jgi:hypothetical protein
MAAWRPAVAAASALMLVGGGHAFAEPMTGEALKEAVSGKHIFLKIPLGGEFPLHYLADGTVEGTSPQSLFANLEPKQDTGRWWVDGRSLCQTWKRWYEGKRYCFTLESTGPGSLHWVRDDGYSGSARIGP